MSMLLNLLFMIVPFSQALVCQDLTPLAKSFQEQKNWEEVEVRDGNGLKPLFGFVDNQNNLHLDSLSRQEKVNATIEIPKTNGNYKAFHKLCKAKFRRRKLLSTYRTKSENNQYRLQARYLPEVEGFANDPLKDLKLTSLDLTIEYTSKSIVDDLYNSDEVKAKIYQHLSQQLGNQKKIGSLDIDLSNYDDLACDLIQGAVKIKVYQRYFSQHPIITMEENISEKTVADYYSTLVNELEPGQQLEERVFHAGVIFSRLKEQDSNVQANATTAYKVFSQFLKKGGPSFKDLSLAQLKCIAGNVQDYMRQPQNHGVSVEINLNADAHLYLED